MQPLCFLTLTMEDCSHYNLLVILAFQLSKSETKKTLSKITNSSLVFLLINCEDTS